ncbi:unnamed protein product [Adineta steineri]|uniref:Lysine-specific metallo-endopeptidase domain-containing protein n=1 Tax=Adineta steineri TaxID=433720 RepID=A0A819NA22_9BILA|nr:unnamed protein product [Adineta steineri]CAF3992338.1 unnamed protein product [Adineta steineri]
MITIVVIHVFGQDLSVSIAPTLSQYSDKQDVEVILNYKNQGSKKVLIYKWYFPDQQLFHPLFEMTRDGKRVAYIGPVVKRRTPVAEDMVSLESGKSISTRVQISSVYNMTETGNYAIRFNVSIGPMLSTSSRLLQIESDVISDSTLVSPSATLFAVGRSNALITESAKVATQGKSLIPSYYKCSSTQETMISASIKSAASYSLSSIQYLSSVSSSGTTRYITWFGTYSSSNLATLKTQYNRINDVFNTKSMSFDCTCTEANTYAYVYPSIPYKIHLCPAFWSAPTTGTDTKGGTLVHETSHFTAVAGTSDYAYGQSACKTLAKSNPTKALDNADSHEYFSENNPKLL